MSIHMTSHGMRFSRNVLATWEEIGKERTLERCHSNFNVRQQCFISLSPKFSTPITEAGGRFGNLQFPLEQLRINKII